jgi:hypothetical protein
MLVSGKAEFSCGEGNSKGALGEDKQALGQDKAALGQDKAALGLWPLAFGKCEEAAWPLRSKNLLGHSC